MGFNRLKNTKYTNTLFTTPSHSQKFYIFNKFRHFYRFDISETDTHSPEIMLDEAEEYAANVYGVKKTKFLTNGSTSGILAAILSTVTPNENVLLWRNAHRCHLNAVKLAHANPIFYELGKNEFGVHCKMPNIEPILKENKIKALIITSPTYEGYVADLSSISKLCKKYGVYLIVDEAHGALYPFSEELPDSAIKYADIIVQSLHKTAGGLNPTALLHSNCNADIDSALNMITTTSPSYPLLMSIEKNIRYLNSTRGRKEIKNLICELKEIRELANIDFGGDDITKILIKKDGMTGKELSQRLYEQGIEDEITNEVSTMLLTGIGTKKDKLDKLKSALIKL